MRFSIALAESLPVIGLGVQPVRYDGTCPDSVHVFIDVLAKIGDIKNATSIIQMRINQVSPEAFEYGKRDLPFVDVHHNSSEKR
jgi:hypothetical protein